MPPALLDSNAISDLMRDQLTIQTRTAAYPEAITTSVVVAGEIRYGLERLPSGKRKNELEARANGILGILRIEPVTFSISETYGHLKAELQGKGLNLEDNDLWIAATAITLGYLLVTRDKILATIPGLQVEDWSI